MEEIIKGAGKVCELLEKGEPCLIGRFGTVEYEVASGGNSWNVLERNAGIFPAGDSSWRAAYLEGIASADLLATGWYAPMAAGEQGLLQQLGWKGQQIKLRSLEPYYVVDRWTRLLANKKVCIVSSFAETMAKQVKKGGSRIWGEVNGETLLPSSTQWSFVRTGYAPVLAKGRATWMEAAGEEINSWQEAVEYVVREVLKTEAKIVLIGCGGLGMILGKRLKEAGKMCIVLGGAVQVLFGVKGMRWKHHEVIGRFWNEEWVWPSLEETPAGSEEVEGGCYWSK